MKKTVVTEVMIYLYFSICLNAAELITIELTVTFYCCLCIRCLRIYNMVMFSFHIHSYNSLSLIILRFYYIIFILLHRVTHTQLLKYYALIFLTLAVLIFHWGSIFPSFDTKDRLHVVMLYRMFGQDFGNAFSLWKCIYFICKDVC